MAGEARQLFSNLVAEVEAEVRRRWAEDESPSVLAKVGLRLGQAARDELSASASGLKAFVSIHMQDQIRVFFDKRLTDCVAPLPESEPFSDRQLADKFIASQGRTDVKPPSPKFKREVWNAFITPAVTRRFIIVTEGGVIQVVDSDESPAGAHEILTTDISFDEEGNRLPVQQLFERIRAWASRNHISMHVLQESAAKDADDHHGASQSVRADTLLNWVLGSLDRDQLKRLSLTGDIITTLMRTRI